ncbi:MAG TPA: O-antigen ligase family protein [Pyrinomonadaceae bacterium]|nr:O-antigen ligase family protein [Pyrinomonadaceae bacterium]
MSSVVQIQTRPQPRSFWIWFAPVQAAVVFSVIAVTSGGQMLRTWLLAALVWLLALPLLVSLEAGLVAMALFEPFRGLIRRAQYLFVDYASQDPIHLLTPIVTLFAFLLLIRSRRLEIFHSTPLAGAVSILGLIYLIEIFNPLQGSLFVGLAGALFMFVPLLWFYFGQSVNEEFISKILKLMVVLGLLTSLYGVYQLVNGYPAFEQYWLDNTDFYDSINVGHVRRALATFSSAEEWGRYAEFGAIAAFGFAAGAKRLGIRLGWLLSGAALMCAVLLTAQRTAVFGLILGVAALVLLGAPTLPRAFIRLGLLLLPIVLVAVFVSPPTDQEMWSKGENETISTLLSHTQRGTLKPADEESFQIRLTNWTYLLTSVVPYRPLGAGLGAGSLSEVRFKSDSDLPAIDSFILVVAVSCGIPGVLLFLWILGRAAWLSLRMARSAPANNRNMTTRRIVAALMPALVLNSVFGLTFTLYSVAPLVWLLIGWISAETVSARREIEREIITI